MLRIVLLCLPVFIGLNVAAQLNYSSHVMPIYKGDESTALSIYDASPESPDGKYICFIQYPVIAQGGHLASPVEASVMLKNRETGVITKVKDVSSNNHNGANALWVNDSLLAFQVGHFKDFEIYNIHAQKSVFGLIPGELGHKSFRNKLFYSKCNARLLIPDKTRKPFRSEEEGIYSFDCLLGTSTQIIRQSEIIAAFMKQNENVSDHETKILHIEPNRSNRKIMFDYRYRSNSNDSWHELHGIVSSKGNNPRWIKVRPMHVVWFDNKNMAGVDTEDTENK